MHLTEFCKPLSVTYLRWLSRQSREAVLWGYFAFGNALASLIARFILYCISDRSARLIVKSFIYDLTSIYLILSLLIVVSKFRLRAITLGLTILFLASCFFSHLFFGFYSPFGLIVWYLFRGITEWRWDFTFITSSLNQLSP